MTRSFLSILALVAISAGASVAQAAPLTFTSRAAFVATQAVTITDDYSNEGYDSGDRHDGGGYDVFSDGAMGAVLDETRYSTTAYDDLNTVTTIEGLTDPFYCAGCNGSFLLDFTATSIGTGDGVRGVGFEFFNDGPPDYVAFVTFGDGTTANYALGHVPFETPAFFGITSEARIRSIAIGLADGGSTHSGYFGLDDLTIGDQPRGDAPVPEPTLLATVALGLCGLAVRGRREGHRGKGRGQKG